MEEQYLTEKHYVVCDKGVAPKQLKVTSQTTTKMSGHLAATEKDTLLDNNFICVGSMMFIAGAAAGVCACIPGPGWIVAAAIAAALIAVAVIGYFKCKAAATSRVWTQQSPVLEIHGKKALLLSSIMMCPAEGGTITPKETFWAAWKSQSLTNLGHIANFAFGFLAGRGAGAIAGEGIAAGMAVEAGGMAAVRTGLQTAGRSFLNAARTELVESFTFKGWKNAGTFCKIMRGLGVGGAYYEQYNIWTSDKDIVDKLKDSSVGLIMSIFAGKGSSLVCFPEGTKVHTDNGLQNIEDLQVGDLVLTYNEETLEQEYKPILVKHERYTMQMMALELPTGEVLEVTPEHRFYHNGEWIEASRLQIGDLLHLKNGDYTTIINIENFPKYQKVYNFDVEGNENYYVTEDGILVHNGYGDRQMTQAEYDELRDLTPNNSIRSKVNEGVTLPMEDPVLPGLTITKNLHADHIVPMDEITRMEGFGQLTKEQRLSVLNNQENFTGLSPTANTSKGSKNFEEWTEYKKGGIKVDETFRQNMIDKSAELRKTLQNQINNFLNKK